VAEREVDIHVSRPGIKNNNSNLLNSIIKVSYSSRKIVKKLRLLNFKLHKNVTPNPAHILLI